MTAPATVLAAPGDTVRVYAGGSVLRDAAGQRWLPARGRLDGRRTRIRRELELTSSPRLYRTVAVGARRARLRLARPGRYAVVLYLAEPGRPSRARRFAVSARGVSRTVDIPVGNGIQRPLHAALETVVRGRSLTLRFRAGPDRPAVAAIEAQRLGPTTMAPIAPLLRDGFEGPAGAGPNPAAWEVLTGSRWGPTQVQAYTDRPANVGLDGAGGLAITARRENYVDPNGLGSTYTSGRLQTRATLPLERTRIEARIRVPAGQGLWPTFWANGVEPPAWPASGELDIMEFSGARPSLLYGFVHGPLRAGSPLAYPNGAVRHGAVPFAAAFHTYAIRTEPGVVEFLLDGRRYGSVSRADIPRRASWLLRRPYHLVLSLAVGGFGGPVNAATPTSARMSVDDVSVWR